MLNFKVLFCSRRSKTASNTFSVTPDKVLTGRPIIIYKKIKKKKKKKKVELTQLVKGLSNYAAWVKRSSPFSSWLLYESRAPPAWLHSPVRTGNTGANNLPVLPVPATPPSPGAQSLAQAVTEQFPYKCLVKN